jgi:hypothetical protein
MPANERYGRDDFNRFSFMSPMVFRALVCVLLPAVSASADPVREEQFRKLKANRSAQFSSVAVKPEPLNQLPAHVPAPVGKLSLWADFANAGDTLVVALYLINRTNETRIFDSEGMDLGITLEYKEGDTWRRAQALPPSSFCGDGFMLVTLEAGHYFRLRGYRPAVGKKATVRYAISNQKLSSNEAPHLVSPHDLDAVAWDFATEAAIPLEVRSHLYFNSNQPLPSRPTLRERINAIEALAGFPRSEAVIARVRHLRDNIASFPQSVDREILRKTTETYLTRHEVPPTSAPTLPAVR